MLRLLVGEHAQATDRQRLGSMEVKDQLCSNPGPWHMPKARPQASRKEMLELLLRARPEDPRKFLLAHLEEEPAVDLWGIPGFPLEDSKSKSIRGLSNSGGPKTAYESWKGNLGKLKSVAVPSPRLN